MSTPSPHLCRLNAPHDGYGDAIAYVEERPDGTLWADNTEYASQIDYCPVCGRRATVDLAGVRRPYVELDDELEQTLFMLLVDHDVAIWERNQGRTDLVWPDLSDIHTRTRQQLRVLIEGFARG